MALVEHFEKLLLGKNDEGYSFCEVYRRESTDARISGMIFMTLEMPNNPLLAEEISQLIFDCLKDNFYHNLEKDPYVRFEEVLKKVNNLVLAKEKEKKFKFISNLNIAVGVIARDNLYLSQAGDAEVYLVRGKYVSIISDGLAEDDSSDELFSNIASGTLEHGDVIVFSSTKLFRYLTEIDLAKLFSNYDLNEGISELKNILSREILGSSAILAVDVKEVDLIGQTDAISREQETFSASRTGKILSLVKTFAVEKKDLFHNNVLAKVKSMEWKNARGSIGRKKNILLLIAVVLVSFLSLGVYRMRVQSSEDKKITELQTDLNTIYDQLTSAKTRANYDKTKAAELLKRADEMARTVLKSGYLKKEASQILEQIKIQQDNLDNVRRIKENERRQIADFTTKRSNVSAVGVLPYKDRLVVFEYNALYDVVLDKVADPLTIDENEFVVRGDYFQDQDALIFMTKSGKILEYKNGIFTFMDTEDKAWRTGSDLASYSDKLYILDPQGNEIWKYRRKRDKYGLPEEYATDIDLTGAVSMAIDGSVYLLKSNGLIEKYYSGQKQNMQIIDSPALPPKNPKVIFTEKDMDEVYVLDPDESRILQYYKNRNNADLNYTMQYVFEDLNEEMRDIYIDKKAQRMYVLTATKLYELEL